MNWSKLSCIDASKRKRKVSFNHLDDLGFKKVFAVLVTGFAVLLTVGTILSLAYTFFVQCPVLKLEYILNSLTIMLTTTEVFFGLLQLGTKCFVKNPYY